MGVAAAIGRRSIWLVNGLINTLVLVVILLLLAFSCYAIWDSGQVAGAASSARYQAFKPTEENESISFQALQAVNPDVFAWLTVYGTNIDYPMVQGTDNIRYVNTNAEGRHSLSGAIFLDFRSAPDFSDFSSIVYGHHMESATMFGEIAMFSDAAYFDARRHGMLYYNGEAKGLEFFAFVHADAYDRSVFRIRITEEADQQEYLDLLLGMAMHTRDDVSVTTNDRIVLLSTCSAESTNGRDILIGKITGDVHPDPFIVERPVAPVAIPAIDELVGSWGQMPLWVQASVIALPLILLILLVSIVVNKRRKRK